ncbi:MAG: M16 family metallopeptidase [Vicinamibacterales bacterium]
MKLSVLWSGYLGLAASLVVLPACGVADTNVSAQSNDVPTIEFEKYTLDNGLEVILSEDHRLPLTAVNVWYHVGPANEEPGRTGFAHLFEHMMFQGSSHVTGDSHIRLLEGAGGSAVNGTTDFDRTNYFETVPSDQLELALWLESDRMGFLLEEVDQAKLSNQQDVVRNERRQGVENQPYGIVEEALYHNLFPQTHPYYASIIGSHADIQAANLEDVRSFFRLYYAPNNATIAIVGDIDPDATKALVEKYFGTLKRGEPVRKPSVETPPITAERRAVVQDRVELPRVYMGWLTPRAFEPGDAEGDIAAFILGTGRSSRLYRSLVYEKQIAQDVTASQYSLQLGSVFEIRATARPGHTAEELEQAIDAELNALRSTPPAQSEIDRGLNTIETQIVRGLERLGGFGGVADRLQLYNHHVGDPGYLDDDIRRMRAVTPAAVQAFVKEELQPTARVVVHGVPGEQQLAEVVPTPAPAAPSTGTGEGVNADEPWRAKPPAPGAARTLQVPVPQSFELPNGLTVMVNERQALPIVSANLVVKSGGAANPDDKPGLANFTAAMLDEGTATRAALEIADQVSQLGASLSTTATMDATQVSSVSLGRTFPDLLGVMADVILNPSFPAEEVERQRASRLAALQQQRDNAGAVANNVMFAALYGTSHPYGYTDLGTEASNRAMTRDDMRAFWAEHFVPNNAALIVSGSISVEELRPMVDRAFGSWRRGDASAPEVGSPTTTRARLVLVDRPGAQQTQVRVASIGLPRAAPDYESVLVMNEALGGLFSSRINLNLREQHGYTYGARSQFLFRRLAGPFLVASGIRTDVTAPAVTEILREVERMRAEPLSPEELALAKDSIVRSLPSEFENSENASASTANTYIYDLGLDYYTRINARIAAVTAEQAMDAARRHLDPERLIVVAVGDASQIRSALQALNLGLVEVRTADGALAQ